MLGTPALHLHSPHLRCRPHSISLIAQRDWGCHRCSDHTQGFSPLYQDFYSCFHTNTFVSKVSVQLPHCCSFQQPMLDSSLPHCPPYDQDARLTHMCTHTCIIYSHISLLRAIVVYDISHGKQETWTLPCLMAYIIFCFQAIEMFDGSATIVNAVWYFLFS